MRKNAIDRILRPIEGGICAPEGFLANAVSVGLQQSGEYDFAMIYTPRRCAVGCVFAGGKTVGAPVTVSKKNMRMGYARAILFNGGVANVCGEGSEKLAYGVCDLLFGRQIERTEIVVASTGELGKPLTLAPFQKGVDALFQGLSASGERSARVARAMQGKREGANSLAFGFYLGDYPCKLGVVFPSGLSSPFLAFLTTDVAISTPMLQRAIETETKSTLELTRLRGAGSPNDCVCILASGRAGNYKIDCVDSEYEKFAYALRAVLTEVCLMRARAEGKAFSCLVRGGKSKEVVRLLAKELAGLAEVKAAFSKGEVEIEPVLYALFARAKLDEKEKIQICISAGEDLLVLYEDGCKLTPCKERLRSLFAAGEPRLTVDLREGNFQALAYGAFEEKN